MVAYTVCKAKSCKKYTLTLATLLQNLKKAFFYNFLQTLCHTRGKLGIFIPLDCIQFIVVYS